MSVKRRLGDVIFETDTWAARAFDVALLWAIVLSVTAVVLESVAGIRDSYGGLLRGLEWVFTGLFTIEYAVRIYVARKRWRYLTSFYGVIDLLAIVPTYLSLFITGSQFLIVIRALRLLRVFRVLKATRYLGEAGLLARALSASREKITVFLVTVLTLVLIIGSGMYLVEGPSNGFTSIPISVYWAIVTLTTVGYGDIAPGTALGKLLSAMVMILGYAIIAVPTGIVTSELTRAQDPSPPDERECTTCGATDHPHDALFCRVCGTRL